MPELSVGEARHRACRTRGGRASIKCRLVNSLRKGPGDTHQTEQCKACAVKAVSISLESPVGSLESLSRECFRSRWSFQIVSAAADHKVATGPTPPAKPQQMEDLER